MRSLFVRLIIYRIMKIHRLILPVLVAAMAACGTAKQRFSEDFSGGPLPSDKIAISALQKYSNFNTLLSRRALDSVDYNTLNGYYDRSYGIVFVPREILSDSKALPAGDSANFTIFLLDTARRLINPLYRLHCEDYFEYNFQSMDMLSVYTNDFVITKAKFHSWKVNTDTLPSYSDVIFAHRIDSPQGIISLIFRGEQAVQARQMDSGLVVISRRVAYEKNFWFSLFGWTKMIGLDVPRYKKTNPEEYYYNRFDRSLRLTKRNKIDFEK